MEAFYTVSNRKSVIKCISAFSFRPVDSDSTAPRPDTTDWKTEYSCYVFYGVRNERMLFAGTCHKFFATLCDVSRTKWFLLVKIWVQFLSVLYGYIRLSVLDSRSFLQVTISNGRKWHSLLMMSRGQAIVVSLTRPIRTNQAQWVLNP